MKKILILAANPKTTPQLRLDEEVREIEEGLRRSKYREQFEIHSKWAVRLRDLRRALLDHEPQIVHFTGHGNKEGLLVEDEVGFGKIFSTEALAGLFKLYSNHIECVNLSACYSALHASAINRHINYVIGMRREIDDNAAIEFAVGFYDALGAGKSVEEAFQFGQAAIMPVSPELPDHLVPVLLKRENGDLPLPPPPEPIESELDDQEKTYSRHLKKLKLSLKQEETLRRIHEKISNELSDSLKFYLSTAVEMKFQTVDELTTENFIRKRPAPIYYINAIHMMPSDTCSVLAINSELLFYMVGVDISNKRGKYNRNNSREKDLEKGSIEGLFRLILKGIEDGWEEITTLNMSVHELEMSPQSLKSCIQSEYVVSISFKLTVGPVSEPMHLGIPYTFINSIDHKL